MKSVWAKSLASMQWKWALQLRGEHQQHPVLSTFFASKPQNGILCDGRVADDFIKHRISLIELAFRSLHNEVNDSNGELRRSEKFNNKDNSLMMIFYGSIEKNSVLLNSRLRSNVEELNFRLSKSELNLSYHNGFIQISDDPQVEESIQRPFWSAVALPMWANVDTDMKEAIDRRDNKRRDASLYRESIRKYDKDHFLRKRLDQRKREGR